MCLVSGPEPRRPRPPGGRHRRAGHPARDGARGQRPDRLRRSAASRRSASSGPMRVIMDPDLGRYPTVWAAAGLPTAVFEVPPATLRILANATVVAHHRGAARGGRGGRLDRARDRRRRIDGRDGPTRSVRRAAQRHGHLPRRPAGALALGRQRPVRGRLRLERGRRDARRPRSAGQHRPRRAVPGRAAPRGTARGLDGPVRLDDPRRAARAATGTRPGCSSWPTASTPSAWTRRRGEPRWEHRSATPIVALLGSPRLAHVIVQAEIETFALEPDGTVAWRVAHSDVVTAAELVGGRLVLTGFDGQLNALDPVTGRSAA